MQDLKQQLTDIIKNNTPKNISLPFKYVSNDISLQELINYNKEIIEMLKKIEKDIYILKKKIDKQDINIYRG